jgi:uroporphyrinogen decarboxylase
MSLSERENYLRNASMTGPEWMPCNVYVSDASWDQWRDEMEDVCARHPTIFKGFEKGKRDYENYRFEPAHRADERFTDAWGCVWYDAVDGLEGQVVKHPIADWEKLKTYTPPDPLVKADRGPADWDAARKRVEEERENGRVTTGGVPHGFLLMRLFFLRGFENLMMDLATEPPQLPELVNILVEHNLKIVDEWLSMNVDTVVFGEDLGTQNAAMISPQTFRRWVAPAYKALMEPCRDAGRHVYLHSDGYIMELVDDLIECGVTILNPQDLCNGIDNLAEHVKGRVCICLDIDRQRIVPFGTREQIRALIEEEVRKLGSPQGGLELIAGIYPPTPPQNVDALCSAMEEFRTYWWDGRRKAQ